MRTRWTVLLSCAAIVVLAGACVADNGQLPLEGQAPVVTSPTDGYVAGPSTLVVGKAPLGSLVVIQTFVFDTTDDGYIKMVPGHRHKVNPDGSFALLVATPRIAFGEKQRVVRYEIHVFTITRDGRKSPSAVIHAGQGPYTPVQPPSA